MTVIINMFSNCELNLRPMRMLASFLVSILLLSQMCCIAAHGQGHAQDRRTLLEDPMFGISYSPSMAHYELMPLLIRKICPSYERGTFWVYAHVQKESGDYYVVMGIVPGQDGDSLGDALRVKDSKCYMEDSTRMLSGFIPDSGYSPGKSAYKLPGVNAPQVCEKGSQFAYGMGPCHYVLQSAEDESILRGLVSDALVRGERAWGDATKFKKEVCSSSLRTANSSMPIVQQELTKFCK